MIKKFNISMGPVLSGFLIDINTLLWTTHGKSHCMTLNYLE